MGCSSCKYLIESKKKEGKQLGCLYYCSKMKKYINGNGEECNNYYKDYSRTSFTRNEIYREGNKYSDDTTSVGSYLLLLIVLIILGLIFNVFTI